MACDEMAAREMRSELGYARCLVTMARRMLGGGLAERPEFVGLFSNNVLEERVMRLMETKTVLSARAKLIRLASGATAMAAATLMATSFHVVPTLAAESEAGLPGVQTAMLRATVPSSADATVGAPVCVHRLTKPAVAPTAPVATKPVAARVAARPVVAPVAVALAPPFATAFAPAVAMQAPQSVPATAPLSPAGTPALPAVAPTAPATPPAPGLAPVKPTTPEVAPVAPASTAEKENSTEKNTYVYRMTGPGGHEVAIINGKVRSLTPEEKEQIERAMEQFKNGDFAKHTADWQREMADLKIDNTFDTREFREKMQAAQHELAQSALVNNAELHAKMQAMVKNFDTQDKKIWPCKDEFAKDKDKDKQKQKKSEKPQNQ
jgi:hypothetical protein